MPCSHLLPLSSIPRSRSRSRRRRPDPRQEHIAPRRRQRRRAAEPLPLVIPHQPPAAVVVRGEHDQPPAASASNPSQELLARQRDQPLPVAQAAVLQGHEAEDYHHERRGAAAGLLGFVVEEG